MLWIVSSGWALPHFAHNPEEAALLENAKGWLFVAVSTAFLGQILGGYFKVIGRSARLLHESEARLRFLGDSLPDSFVYEYTRNPDGSPRMIYISAGVERIHGLTAESVMSDASLLFAQMDPEQIPGYLELEEKSARNLTEAEIKLRMRREDGMWREILVRSRPSLDAHGTVRWYGLAVDITEKSKAQKLLEKSESLLKEVEQTAKTGGWDLDPATGELHWTEEVSRIYDLEPAIKPDREMGLTFFEGESRGRIEAAMREACKYGTPFDLELQMRSARGVRKRVRALCRPVFEHGKLLKLNGSLQDISGLASEANRAILEAALAGIAHGVFITDSGGRVIELNEGFASFLRFETKEQCPMQFSEYAAFLELLKDGCDHGREEIVPVEQWPIARALRGEKGTNVEYTLRRKDTGEQWAGSFSFAPILDEEDGEIAGAVAVGRDITEKKQALAAIKESEENFRAMFELASVGMGQADPATRCWVRVNKKLCEITGYGEGELLKMRIEELTHPDDREENELVLEKLATGKIPEWRKEKRFLRKEGSLAWVNLNLTVIHDASGQVIRLMAAIDDITERKHLEEEFRQSQKMEAIGRLAGGVAHDFNNILCLIRIEAELAESGEESPEDLREDLHQIRAAVERAAELTRQLMLFSRRQAMQQRNLDLNEAVTNMAKMLGRIIREDVNLEVYLSPTPLITHADPGMIDQIMMNLAVNARDAMPEGGLLRLETSEKVITDKTARLHPGAIPGRYVCLSVIDTGWGMSAEVKARIFEPFFTTKRVGEGTGLGLATVFGIVKQHHGWIQVDSAPGKGTTFRIYFPATEATLEESETEAASVKPGGTETILVVEDDPFMRLTATLLLERSGYKALIAPEGTRAIELWEQHRDQVALLLSDLVMPGMSGMQLASRLLKENPKLKVVYSSGYNSEIAGSELELRDGENFLPKPFTTEQFLQTIRRALDAV